MEFTHNLNFYSSKLHTFAFNCYQTLRITVNCCQLCGQKCLRSSTLCQYCFDDLPKFNYALCNGNLLSWPAIHKSISNKYFDRLIALAPYQWPYATWISQCKYKHRFDLASLLADALAQQWTMLNNTTYREQLKSTTAPELVLCVPIHFNRWKHRGFNQANLIAQSFAKAIKLAYDGMAIRRIKNSAKQVGQSGKARRMNLRGAFDVSNSNTRLPEHVILIDDVVTTGTTVNEISRLLKKNGVKQITVLALCLSLPRN